jgi:hypothetical protein
MSRASSLARAFGADGTLNTSDVSGLGALAALNTVGTSQIDDSAITNGKLAADGLDASKLTTGTLPIAQIADGSITQAKVNDNAGGLRPEWTEIRFNGYQVTDSVLETPNKIFINNGNNGSSASGRLQGSAKGVFRVRFELGFLWGWSEFILYPRDLWDASASASMDMEPAGRTAIKVMNNSSNNLRLGNLWTGSGSTTQWLTQGGTTAVWTAWRDSSNDIRIFDGSTTTLVTNSSEEFVVLSGLQSPHYTRIYEAGSYK